MKNDTLSKLILILYKQLTSETSIKTEKSVNSGKNKYRMTKKMKNWMIETSKLFDESPKNQHHIIYQNQIQKLSI